MQKILLPIELTLGTLDCGTHRQCYDPGARPITSHSGPQSTIIAASSVIAGELIPAVVQVVSIVVMHAIEKHIVGMHGALNVSKEKWDSTRE
jgi:hypothetical protein